MLYMTRTDELPIEHLVCGKDKRAPSPVIATVPYKGLFGFKRERIEILRTIRPPDYFFTKNFETADPYSGEVHLFAHRAPRSTSVWIAFWCPTHKRYSHIDFHANGNPYFIPIKRRSRFIQSHYVVIGDRLFLLKHVNHYYSVSIELIEQSYADISHIYDLDLVGGTEYRHWVTESNDELILFVDEDKNPFFHNCNEALTNVKTVSGRCARSTRTTT